MDKIKELIDAIIDAETDDDDPSRATNDVIDRGGRTQYGISEKANPAAWADGKVTEEEARAIYLRKYVEAPGFTRILDHRLQHFLVDWGVISGPSVPIEHLQRALGVTVDGKLGPKTAEAANASDQTKLLNRLVDDRIRMTGRIVNRNPSQAKWLNGWINRALEFRV